MVSGYVPILFGRSRATEDVDIFIEEISKYKFLEFLMELEKNGWWCINTENSEEIFSYLNSNLAVRFADKKCKAHWYEP